MEQTAENEYVKRHNLFYFRNAVRRQIISNNDSERNRDLEELWNQYPQIPAICARQSPEVPEGWLDAGVSFPLRDGNGRRKFSIRVPLGEIWGVQTPWELTDYSRLPDGKIKDALQFVKDRKRPAIRLGSFGSAALQIATELPYLDDASDVDLVIEGGSRDDVDEFRKTLLLAFEKYGISFDVELRINNEYYVKLQELFAGTGTVLAKSEYDVKLVEIQEIWDKLEN